MRAFLGRPVGLATHLLDPRHVVERMKTISTSEGQSSRALRVTNSRAGNAACAARRPRHLATRGRMTAHAAAFAAPRTKTRKPELKPHPKKNLLWPSPRQMKPGSPIEGDLVQQHLPLVKTVVARVAMTLPAHVDGEDLYSAGLTGLLNAVRHYNPRAGTSFETYARVRIRGAVLDELRRMDWVPRSVHTKARKVQAVMQQLEQAKGRPATEDEMACALRISVGEYQRWLDEIRPATFICLDAVHNSEAEDPVSQYESLADQRQEDPTDGAYRHELSRLISQRIQELPEMQRKVLALYYYEDMRLREIAEVFGLTESRICQIHSQAILNVKSYLQRFDPCFA
jgi:RNA polymerase sigma factor FliA